MSTHLVTIRRSDGTESSFSRDQVYFGFPSGRLNYDCVSCGASCCKGHGFGLTEAELRSAVTLQPELMTFVQPVIAAHSSHFVVSNVAPACFFLASDGLCRIQTATGYSNKPETCRLFPFNDFRLVGRNLIVLPHMGLCPLAVLPPGVTSERSDHDVLFQQMTRAPIGGRIDDNFGADDAAIDLERSLAVRLGQHDQSPVAVACQQIAITDSRRSSPAQVEYKLRAMRRVLSLSASLPLDLSEALNRTFLAIVPSLRIRLLYPHTHSDSFSKCRASEVPSILLALRAVSEAAVFAGMSEMTYQAIMQLFLRYQPALRLIALAGDRVEMKGKVPIDLSWGGDAAGQALYIDVLKQLVVSPRREVGEIIGEAVPENAAGRLFWLNELGKRFEGRLRDRRDSADAHDMTMRYGVLENLLKPLKLFALTHLTTEQLTVLARKKARRKVDRLHGRRP